MDPALLPEPIEMCAPIIREHSLVFATASEPLCIPMAWLPAAARLDLILASDAVPLETQISLALSQGAEAAAWRTIRRRLRGSPLPERLGSVLQQYLNTTMSSEKAQSSVLMRGASATQASTLRIEAAAAISFLDTVFHSLGRQWYGPVILGPVREGLTSSTVAKPLLPEIFLPLSPGLQWKQNIATAMTQIRLDLACPANAGWPAWLRLGLETTAKTYAIGSVPLPAQTSARRQKAGVEGLRRLFDTQTPDPQLSADLCSWILHSHRRAQFASLLDGLRAGLGSEEALKLAYSVDLEGMLERP